MAKLDDFDPFSGATPPVAPSAQPAPPPQDPPDAQGDAEPPEPPSAPKETRKAAKTRQRPSQPRTEATQPAPTPSGVPSAAEIARWTHWLNATAGKLGRTLTGASGALAAAQAWQQAAADARAAGVGDFPIQYAAMRALQQAPEAVAAVVAATAELPELQRAVVQAIRQVLGPDADGEDAWLHE